MGGSSDLAIAWQPESTLFHKFCNAARETDAACGLRGGLDFEQDCSPVVGVIFEPKGD